MLRVIHGGNIGDTIYSLYAMRQASRNAGQKIHLYLCINQPGQLAPGHPSGQVMMSQTIAEMAKPLFEAIDFIGEVTITSDPKTEVDYDFNKFRELGLRYTGSISRWYFYAYPELTCDLSEPIHIQVLPFEPARNKIIFNRTTRYHGEGFEYLYLRPWADRMIFVGLESEYNLIRKKLPGMEFVEVENFLQMAAIIKTSDLFIGGQSMAFAIAEITKVPRIVEVCQWAHNVIPMGRNGYDAIDIISMRKLVEQLQPIGLWNSVKDGMSKGFDFDEKY